MKNKLVRAWLISLPALLFLCGSAAATTIGFYNITGNDTGDAAIGEAQLSVEVESVGNQVLFTFSNSGPEEMSIADVYFDNGTLLAIASGATLATTTMRRQIPRLMKYVYAT